MITEIQLEEYVKNIIEANQIDVYIAAIKIKRDNIIYIFLDSDNTVKIENCIVITKELEKLLDRDDEDFELNVSSYGAEEPLRFARQYKKNIDRELLIEKIDGNFLNGILIESDDKGIIIKTIPKKKKEEPTEITLSYSDIKEAKIKIQFKK